MKQIKINTWQNIILVIAKHYGKQFSETKLKLDLAWQDADIISEDIIVRIASQVGLHYKKVAYAERYIDPWRLPLVLELSTQQLIILESIHSDGAATIRFVDEDQLTQTLPLHEITQSILFIHIFRPEKTNQDVRVDEYIKPFEQNWFWSIVLNDWKRYFDIMLASLVANILALASIIFSMQVYDRVVPAQSIPTLWVLAIGVLVAAIFEFILRLTRVYLSDMLGKRSDLRLSDRVFGHALRIKNSERPKSTGTFISQIRELESVREMATSTTVTAIADLPFFFLFLAIFALIGGNLFWVVLLVVPFMLLPAILAQKSLAKLAKEGMRESSVRNALLVEAVQGIEDIKIFRAENRFQNQWNHMNDSSAEISLKQRKITGFLSAWTQKIQGLTHSIVVLVGCFAVMNAEMTTGALVACSILASRMLSPITSIAGVLGRYQQAKSAKQGLDELMKKAVDYPEKSQLIHRPRLHGNFTLNQVIFHYDEEQPQANLMIQHLKINAGEKIAILGKNGAGKSTLLQLLLGMQIPQKGQILLDDVDMTLLDPYDIRRDTVLLNQNSQLFFGTIRENLSLGVPQANDEDLISILKLTGAWDFVQKKKEGLDHLILEGGVGFSGGQKQLLLLSRLLLTHPQTILLDEPTAWLDEVCEKKLIDQLKPWLKNKTLVVATHRRAVLDWADRIIIVQDGKVMVDGPKEQVLGNSVPKKTALGETA